MSLSWIANLKQHLANQATTHRVRSSQVRFPNLYFGSIQYSWGTWLDRAHRLLKECRRHTCIVQQNNHRTTFVQKGGSLEPLLSRQRRLCRRQRITNCCVWRNGSRNLVLDCTKVWWSENNCLQNKLSLSLWITKEFLFASIPPVLLSHTRVSLHRSWLQLPDLKSSSQGSSGYCETWNKSMEWDDQHFFDSVKSTNADTSIWFYLTCIIISANAIDITLSVTIVLFRRLEQAKELMKQVRG